MIHPALIPRESNMGVTRLHYAAPVMIGPGACRPAFPPALRRAWDSNPRGRFRALAVFKTAAIGH